MKRFSEFHALRKALTKISSGSVPAIPARRTLRKHTDTEFIKRRAEALGTHRNLRACSSHGAYSIVCGRQRPFFATCSVFHS